MVKLAGNFLIISAMDSLIEALSMAGGNGIDPMAVVDMLTTTLFPAPIHQNYGRMIAGRTATFDQSGIPLKDTGLFMHAAARVNSPTPISTRLYDLMTSAKAGSS